MCPLAGREMGEEWSWSDLATKARTRFMETTNDRDGRDEIMREMEFHEELDGSPCSGGSCYHAAPASMRLPHGGALLVQCSLQNVESSES